MNQMVRENILNIHSGRIEGIVTRIDECWKYERKEAMRFYINYIQETLDFIDGIKRKV